ncbi:transposase [Patescibacteria group bacterium]|nr:transposase [Patescibacteria group bacterium]
MYKDYPNRKLNRMRGYDYSQNGFYFVTICLKNKIEYFGSIKNGQMIINKFGKIVEYCWYDLINHYGNCRLDEFIIMPNHVHGIVEINNNREGAGLKPARTDLESARTLINKKYSLSEMIRGFKSFSSRRINEVNFDSVFRWQRSFYDHIIQNDGSLYRIRKYIKNNPLRWELDRNNNNEN